MTTLIKELPIDFAKFSNDVAAPFKCRKCERTFDHPQGVRMHYIRTHTSKNWDSGRNFHKGGERNGSGASKCPVCGESYNSRNTMTRHMRMIHHKSIKDLEPERHGCPYCEFDSGTRAGLTRHINNHHPGKTGFVEMRRGAAEIPHFHAPTTSAQPHFCPRCGEDQRSWRKESNEEKQ